MKKMTEVYLPEEVLVEIFKRLPVESLLRFRSVSKSWCSLITSPQFVTLHRNYSMKFTRFLVNSEPAETYALHYDNDAFELHTEVQSPFERPRPQLYNCHRVVGSCHGLICIEYYLLSNTKYLFLWNPSIRKIVALPTPGIAYKFPKVYEIVFGFGFDSKSNDYKVVRMVYLQGRNKLSKVPLEVELYKLSTGAWRGISAVAPPYVMGNYSLQANMNGIVHWIASSSTNICGLPTLILAFDLSHEVFKEMRLPNTLAHEYPEDMSITACGELLSLYHYYENSSSNWCCSVWVMEKYGMDNSWNKLFNIELSQGVVDVLGSRKNGELLVVTSDEKLVSYDPNDKRVNDLGICGGITCSVYVNTCIESLVLLDRAYGFSDYDSVTGLLGKDASEIQDRQMIRNA